MAQLRTFEPVKGCRLPRRPTINTSMKCVAIALIGVLGSAATAFAQQPSPDVTTQPVVPASAPTVPNTTTTSATTAPSTGSQGQQTTNARPARPAPEIIKEARRDGYVLKIKSGNGNYVFCRTDANVGTRFTTEKCLDVGLFALMQQQQQRDRDQMRSTIEGFHCDLKSGC